MRNILRKAGRFFRIHWKAIAIIVVAIILIVVGISLVKKFTGGNTASNGVTSNTGGTTGVIEIDGTSVSVFDTKDDATVNPITVDSGVKTISVNGDNVKVSTNAGAVSHLSGKDYELNLDGLADGTPVMVTIKTGGDGSFVGQMLSKDVETHYLVVNVNNPNAPSGTTGTAPAGTTPSTAPATSGVPTGSVKFGDSSFKTYGSEAEAQNAVAGKENQFTIPTSMAKNIVLTAEPSEGTARIWASVCMVDGEDVTGMESRMNADSNWTATFDVSNYTGHQVTIVLKAEDSMALSNGYSYVSFFVPQFEAEEEHIDPVVVTD